MGIRVLIGDDKKIVRLGLLTLLKINPDIEIVGEAEDGWSTVRMAEELLPDVVIVEVDMPDLNGVEVTRRIVTRHPAIKVLGLSNYLDGRIIRSIMKAGASGYLTKNCPVEELIQAIHAAIVGQTFLSPSIADMIIKDYLRYLRGNRSPASSVLTPRERGVLQLLADGRSMGEIALELKISVKTVETYRRQIREKLGIRAIAQLTKYAILEGLTSLQI
jgi:DNA-binding NarL/FixJ family response regulator